MAKFTGLVGTGAGKAGNFVFAKGPKGTTVVRAYQPNVHNPNTLLQREQRAKMALAGTMAGAMDRSFLQALGKTALFNRAAAAAQILKGATTSTDYTGRVAATFDPRRINLTNSTISTGGSVSVPSIPELTEGQSRQVQAAVTIPHETTTRQYDVMVMVTYTADRTSDSKIRPVINTYTIKAGFFEGQIPSGWLRVSVDEAETTDTFNVPVRLTYIPNLPNVQVSVFVNPYEPGADVTRSDYNVVGLSNLQTEDTNWNSASYVRTSGASNNRYYRTVAGTASSGTIQVNP